MNYQTLKAQHQTVVNDFPMEFAFSEKQLVEALEKLECTKDEVYSGGSGMIYRKTDSKKLAAMFDSLNDSMETWLKDDKFFMSAISYEIANHEYGYTYEIQDSLDALGLSVDDLTDKQKELIQVAVREYMSTFEG